MNRNCNLSIYCSQYVFSCLLLAWWNRRISHIVAKSRLAKTAALRFVHAVSWAMFFPSFRRLTAVGTATAASCNGSLLLSPLFYSNSGGADGSRSGFGGIASGGSAAIGGGTGGNGAIIGAAATAGIGTTARGIGAAASPPLRSDSRICTGVSGRLLCPPFSVWIPSKSLDKESSKSPGSLRNLPSDGSVSNLLGSIDLRSAG